MDAIGGIENSLALFEDERGLVVVDHGRREQRQAGVAMFFVVPAKESLTERTAVLNAPEAVWELQPICGCREIIARHERKILGRFYEYGRDGFGCSHDSEAGVVDLGKI